MQESDGIADNWRAVLCVGLSLGAFFLFESLIPSIAPASGIPGHYTRDGRFLGCSAAVVCIAAFLWCPRRAVFAKLSTLLLLIPGVYTGVECLLDSVLTAQGPFKTAQYLLLCQRVRWC